MSIEWGLALDKMQRWHRPGRIEADRKYCTKTMSAKNASAPHAPCPPAADAGRRLGVKTLVPWILSAGYVRGASSDADPQEGMVGEVGVMGNRCGD